MDPGRFIAARDDLVRRLKEQGRSEDAAGVRALRRPTVAAWTVNRLARLRRSEVADLVDAGDHVRRAQRRALSGVRDPRLREAGERRRQAVSKLIRAADELLRESGGGSAGVLEAVRATLEAASLDERSAQEVQAGRLSRELRMPTGFGEVGGFELVVAPEPPRPPKGRGASPAEDPAARKRLERRDAAARDAKELESRAATARRQAIRAREAADRAKARADRLSRDADSARTEARDTEREARAAEREATRATEAAERKTAEMERLERSLGGRA